VIAFTGSRLSTFTHAVDRTARVATAKTEVDIFFKGHAPAMLLGDATITEKRVS
jgi:hypothetical protein